MSLGIILYLIIVLVMGLVVGLAIYYDIKNSEKSEKFR